MFLILAKEETQHLKGCLFVWSSALRFPNKQQPVKKFKHTEKKNAIEEKIAKEKHIRMSNAKECAENWLFSRLMQLLKASTEEEELF